MTTNEAVAAIPKTTQDRRGPGLARRARRWSLTEPYAGGRGGRPSGSPGGDDRRLGSAAARPAEWRTRRGPRRAGSRRPPGRRSERPDPWSLREPRVLDGPAHRDTDDLRLRHRLGEPADPTTGTHRRVPTSACPRGRRRCRRRRAAPRPHDRGPRCPPSPRRIGIWPMPSRIGPEPRGRPTGSPSRARGPGGACAPPRPPRSDPCSNRGCRRPAPVPSAAASRGPRRSIRPHQAAIGAQSAIATR